MNMPHIYFFKKKNIKVQIEDPLLATGNRQPAFIIFSVLICSPVLSLSSSVFRPLPELIYEEKSSSLVALKIHSIC
jgi:hypothetical protein